MSLNLNAGAEITLSDAQDLVKAFQEKFPNEIRSSRIDSELVYKLLSQEGCVGMRVYNGYDIENERLSPVLVGVNELNEDMTSGVILDRMIPCPSECPSNSDLM